MRAGSAKAGKLTAKRGKTFTSRKRRERGRLAIIDKQKWPLLGGIHGPDDLKTLPREQYGALAAEIRDYLVLNVTEHGGHLASNLGVVELTMAIHLVFAAPRDHILFDVGHQSYVHKLLTGRDLDDLREPGGTSGFTKRTESVFDPFGAGHSSTAVSAALGFAEADRLAGRDTFTVAVVGDGASTGGLSFEGLDNCPPNRRLILILNENEMSISPNTGRLARHFSRIRASKSYLRTKKLTRATLTHIPLIGRPVYRMLRWFKRRVKHSIYRETVFEHLGLHYLGPVDGNDLPGLIACLSYAKSLSKTVLLHVKTVKGKGYEPAEKDPGRYHSLPPAACVGGETFSDVFGKTLVDVAKNDEKLTAITAAMSQGTGLDPFRAAYPDRFYDVGIAEGHALTFAAALAAGGAHPAVALYSTFFQRGYDNLLHDAVLQDLPLLLCLDRAGVSERDGTTHHGIYDVALLSHMPGVRILAPVTFDGLSAAVRQSVGAPGVRVIRYPAGGEDAAVKAAFYPETKKAPNGAGFSKSDPEAKRDGSDFGGVRVFDTGAEPQLTIITHGPMTKTALAAAERLNAAGVAVRVILCEFLTPYPDLAAVLKPFLVGRCLLTAEEEVYAGGFGMNLLAALNAAGETRPAAIVATRDGRLTPPRGGSYKKTFSVDADAVCAAAGTLLKGEVPC